MNDFEKIKKTNLIIDQLVELSTSMEESGHKELALEFEHSLKIINESKQKLIKIINEEKAKRLTSYHSGLVTELSSA